MAFISVRIRAILSVVALSEGLSSQETFLRKMPTTVFSSSQGFSEGSDSFPRWS